MSTTPSGSLVDARPCYETAHDCDTPRARKKWKNRLWICDYCGQAWRTESWINYASGPVYSWTRWRP